MLRSFHLYGGFPAARLKLCFSPGRSSWRSLDHVAQKGLNCCPWAPTQPRFSPFHWLQQQPGGSRPLLPMASPSCPCSAAQSGVVLGDPAAWGTWVVQGSEGACGGVVRVSWGTGCNGEGGLGAGCSWGGNRVHHAGVGRHVQGQMAPSYLASVSAAQEVCRPLIT